MKIPGKFPLQTITKKLSDADKKVVDSTISVNSTKSIVSLNTKEILYKKINKSFSIRLLNYVEPYLVKGQRYTLFYTEVDHNLKLGDRVFITGGQYDSDLVIQKNKFNKLSDGYIVQYVDRTKVVLDIEYNGNLPYIEEPLDNFVKVYVASSQEEFDYFIQTTSTRDYDYVANRFSNYGTFSNNNFLYINGTFSVTGNEYGILGFTSSGISYLTYSNSFLVLSGTISGYLRDITIDVISGSHSNYLSLGLTNNGDLKIMNSDFEKSGIKFKRGYTYNYESTWKVDRKYLNPIITEQNFRNGTFKKGEFNQGLLGTHQETINYSGSDVKFSLGSILNTKWIIGNIGKGIGSDESYFTSFDEFGLPNIKINAKNNSGIGYNYVYDSYIKNSIIENGTFNDSIIGSFSSELVLGDYLISQTPTYSVTTKSGNYINSDIIYSNILNSSLFSSIISNSKIFKSKSVNSEFEKSLFLDSKFTSDKIIKIQNYDEKIFNWYNGVDYVQYKMYKFYINDDGFKRLKENQSFYFDGLNITKNNLPVLNFFDDKFTIDSYYSTFDDNTKGEKRVITQLSTKEDNYKIPTGLYGSVSININYGYPSIDIIICASPSNNIEDFNSQIVEESYGPYIFDISQFLSTTSWNATLSVLQIFYSGGSPTISSTFSNSILYDELTNLSIGTWTYSGNIFSVEGSYTYDSLILTDGVDFTEVAIYSTQSNRNVFSETIKTLDISNAYLVDSDFKSGLFKDSTWISGNYINYNKDNSLNTGLSSSYYDAVNIDSSLGTIELSVYSNYRRELFKESDILFINGLYYDTTLTGGDNLVKLPETYKVNSNSPGGNGRVLKISDAIYVTSSVLFNVTNAVSVSSLTTKFALNAYNYLHPVKFENSKIQSGIFRRSYFKDCIIDNQLFNNLDKDPINYNNWRSLLLSDILFTDNNNTIKSGLIINSSFISGTDKWENGIFYNSIWNVDSFTWSNSATGSNINSTITNKFKNGIVKESTWINGIFENGLFYKNKSNLPLTSDIYSDLKQSYYKQKNLINQGITRYSWQNGTFENGSFELSNFENGLFSNGDFYNSTFLTGKAISGNFGKRNLKYPLTRILSGSFSNINVISAEFKTENPTGATSGSFQIDWYNGIFNNGLFGVKIDESMYESIAPSYPFNAIWYDGTFNNGSFDDIAIWKNGEFNNGKFTSYYGYPYVTAASYSSAGSSSFAWQDGKFNGGEFGNASLGTNSTWYDGEFNGGIFIGRYWNSGILTKGYFIGSGTESTNLSNIPSYVSNFSDSFYGLWNNGYVSEVKDIAIKNKKTFTKLERQFTKKKKSLTVEFKNSLWRGGTFSHNNAIMENSVWTGGSFLNGKFYKSSFNPYVNYLVNGNFQLIDQNNLGSIGYWNNSYTDFDYDSGDIIGAQVEVLSNQLYSNDSSKLLKFLGTSSILNINQTSGLIIGETYTLRLIVDENYNNEIRFGNWTSSLRNRNLTEGISGSFSNWILSSTSSSTLPTLMVATGSPGYIEYDASTSDSIGYIIYPDILDIGKIYTVKFYTFDEISFTSPYVGSCDSSQVIIESGVLQNDFIINTNFTYSVPSGTSNEYFLTFEAAYSDLVLQIIPNTINTTYKLSGFILTGNTILTSSDISSKTSFSYTFNAVGPDFCLEFIPKTIPNLSSVPSWNIATCSISNIEVVKGTSGFNISDNCYWDNGIFEDSEFYISKWNNGKWISGTAVGMIWKNGVANYMNSYNIYWEGGVWRNGNWNGSPFSYDSVNPNGCLYTYGSIANLAMNSVWDNLDLSNSPLNGSSRVFVDTSITNGASFSFVEEVSGFYSTYQDTELDIDNSLSLVNSVGLPFIKTTSPNQFTLGNKYKITITIGTVSIANVSDLSKIGIQFSIGRPGEINASYGETTGTYNGSLYPSAIEVASGEDSISIFHYLSDLEGHVGSSVPDLLISGVDGYQATLGGTITEILTSRDDGKFYLHVNPYGTSDFYIDSIIIQEESCTPRIEVNEGYVSDILTNISLYRQSVNDNSYRDVFINDAFTVSVDPSWLVIQDQPNITSLSFTQSVVSSQQRWKYSTSYTKYLNLTNCTTSVGFAGGPYVWNKGTQVMNNTNYYIEYNGGNYLYALNTSQNRNIFRDFGQYDIEIKYVLQYGPTFSEPLNNIAIVGFQVEVGYFPGYDNGGFVESISQNLRVYQIGCPPSGTWYGQSDELTWTSTFEPTSIGATYSDLDRLKIKKISGTSGGRVIITSAKVVKKTSQYSEYNCATYSMLNSIPSYNDNLLLPSIDLIGGLSNGNIISTRFGNGIFTSGTASAFSSIWENGVWNEGLRYDKYVYLFDDFDIFPGTSKPLSFPGSIDIKSTKIGNIASSIDNNLTKIKTSTKNWIISLRKTKGYIHYDGLFLNQQDFNIPNYFKVGDKVAVGNIVSLDSNNTRKLIRDYFTVIEVSDDIIKLQVTLNFPIRRISKDSENHLISLSKNIWLNGAFLNGLFKGIWNNGLFKGRPYITKMIDSQWIDGRFEGGRFKGLTMSIQDDIDNSNEDRQIVIYPSGLVQNFIFKDENIGFSDSTTFKNYLKYNSWIDVNYFTSSMTNIYRDSISWDANLETNKAILNYNGYPTKDILSSISSFKNTFNDDIKDYSLGWKYQIYDDYIENPFFNYPINSTQSFVTGLFESDVDGLTESYEMGVTYSIPGLYRFTKNNKWRTSILTPSFSGVTMAPFLTANTSVDNIDKLKIFSVTQSSRPFLLENDNTKNIPKFRYSIIEFEMNHQSQNNGFKYPYLLNEPQAKLFTGDDLVSYISAVPDIVGHNQTSEIIKKEYFYNKPSLQMVMAQTLYFYDIIASGGGYNLGFTGSNPGLTGGDVVYVSKRNVNLNGQINRFFIIEDITIDPVWGYLARISIPYYDNTPLGTDGGVVFVLKPYTTEFDYIKMYEVDAIPFFYYAGEDRINQSIQAPLSSVAPQINYSDSEFSLIDSINITETLFETAINPVISFSGGIGSVETTGSSKGIFNLLPETKKKN